MWGSLEKFHMWKAWKNLQCNFLTPNLSIEHNFFRWDGKVSNIWYLLFHRVWINTLSIFFHYIFFTLAFLVFTFKKNTPSLPPRQPTWHIDTVKWIKKLLNWLSYVSELFWLEINQMIFISFIAQILFKKGMTMKKYFYLHFITQLHVIAQL